MRCASDGGFDIHVQNYHEHGVGAGEDATAVAYVQLRVGAEQTVYGVGLDPNIVTATLRAVVSAVNRGIAQGMLAQPTRARRARTVRLTRRPARPVRSGAEVGWNCRVWRIRTARIMSCAERRRSSRPPPVRT